MIVARPRARIVVALLVLGALLLVAQAVAQPKREGSRTALARAAGRVERWQQRSDPHAVRDQLQALASTEDLDAGIDEVSRTAILRIAGLDSYPPVEDEGTGILLPAGDLTADGGEDAIEWYWGDGVDAVRGTDGRTLWGTRTGSFMAPLFAGPLDTQVGDDLVLLSISSRTTTGRRILTLRYEAVQGSTGRPIWTRTFDSQITGVSVGPTSTGVQLDLALPHAAAELNGDGALDLVIGRYQTILLRDPGTSVRQFRVAATYESISGKDGITLGEAPASGRSFFPDASLVPDLNGDGLQDLVTASYEPFGGDVQARFTAFPGKAGAPSWTREHTFEEAPYLQGAELNGDGKGDLVVEAGWFPSTTLAAVSGQEGSLLWSRQESGGVYTVPGGNADKLGGQDLFVFSFFSFSCHSPSPYGYGGYGGYYGSPPLYGYGVYGYGGAGTGPYGYGGYGGYVGPPPYGYGGYGWPSPYGYGYGGYGYGGGCKESPPDVSMISGNTGMPLWSYRSDDFFSDTSPVGDVTGDGVDDVLVTWFDFERSQGVVGRGLLLSGSTGASVWSWSEPWSYLFGLFANVDGDGGDDLLRLDFQQYEDRYAVVSGSTGKQLWDLVGAKQSHLDWIEVASLDNDGFADLLETAHSHRGGWDEFTAAREGVDGTRVWRRG